MDLAGMEINGVIVALGLIFLFIFLFGIIHRGHNADGGAQEYGANADTDWAWNLDPRYQSIRANRHTGVSRVDRETLRC